MGLNTIPGLQICPLIVIDRAEIRDVFFVFKLGTFPAYLQHGVEVGGVALKPDSLVSVRRQFNVLRLVSLEF